MDLPGKAQDVVEDAVDPVADLHNTLVGLDVDVACPVLCRPGKEEVDQLDDRGVARFVQEVARLLDFGDDAVRGFLMHLLEELLGRAPAEIVGEVDRRLDRLLGRQNDGPLRPAEEPADVVHGLEIRGVVDRHDESLWRLQGNDLLLFQVLDGDDAGEINLHVVCGELLPERDAVFSAQGRQQNLLRQKLFLEEEVDHSRAVCPGLPPHLGQYFRRSAQGD